MKLQYTLSTSKEVVQGTHAVLVRDDVNGSTLILQSGSQRLDVRLSDLVGFISSQEAEKKREQEESDKQKNPESPGSKGDSEAE